MSRKRKVQVFVAVILFFYFFGAIFGALGRSAGQAKDVVGTVKRQVKSARKRIKREMKKPFPERTFSTKRSMESNDLKVMKTTLPPLLGGAMPRSLKKYFMRPPPSSNVACAGMRLVDALLFLQEHRVTLEEVFWAWDDRLEGKYVQFSGTVLRTNLTKSEGARLVIQLDHDFDTERGLGKSPDEQRGNLDLLGKIARETKTERRILYGWLLKEDEDKLHRLAASGFPMARWCNTEIPHVDG